MTRIIICELLAFVFYFLYGSFFEWAFHKHLFHSPKFIKATYKAHAIVHHQKFKYETESYEWHEGKSKEHIAMDWFALPLFLGVHLPLFIFIEWITGIPSALAGLAAITAYYAVYEYYHYCMHVPEGRRFETFKIFIFAKEHHRLHHRHPQRNLNVYFPLADKCLGTFISVPKFNAQQNLQENLDVARTINAKPMTVKPLRQHDQVEAFAKK